MPFNVMTFEIAPATWQQWGYAVLALVMVMAIESDMRTRRIPNVLVVFALSAGLLLNTLGPANGREGLLSHFPGALGISQALLGGLVGLAVFLPLYLLRATGAGDVKLMAALGAFVGPVDVVSLALSVLVAGGALAVVRMLQKRNSRLVLNNVMVALGHAGQGGTSQFDPSTQSLDRMPYALAFAAGLMAYGYWRRAGGMPFLNF